MFKKFVLVLVAAVFVLGLSAISARAAEIKLGYVDLSKLFDGYQKTKDYDKLLSDKEKAYETERDKKVADVKQLQDKLSLLSEKEKANKQAEFDNKVKALQDYDQQKQTDLRKERDEKIKEILQDIDKAIRAYAEKEGYTLVFNDRVLVYQQKQLDITDKIVDILGKGGSK